MSPIFHDFFVSKIWARILRVRKQILQNVWIILKCRTFETLLWLTPWVWRSGWCLTFTIFFTFPRLFLKYSTNCHKSHELLLLARLKKPYLDWHRRLWRLFSRFFFYFSCVCTFLFFLSYLENSKFVKIIYFFFNLQNLWKFYLDWHHGLWRSGWLPLFHDFFYSSFWHMNSKFVNLSYQIGTNQINYFFLDFQDLWKPYLDWHHGLWWSGHWWQWNIPRYVAISSPTEFGAEFVVSFFLSLLFSRSQVVNFFKWKHHYLSENIAIFHSNDDLFNQYLFLNEKGCHLMTFSWKLESERTRSKGKRNHKFRTYVGPEGRQKYVLY